MQLSTPYYASFITIPLFSLIAVLYASFYYISVYQELADLSFTIRKSVAEFSVTTNIAWEQIIETKNLQISTIQKRSVSKKSIFIDRIIRNPLFRSFPAWCQCEPIVPRCPPGPPGPPGCRGDMGMPGLPGRRGLNNFETVPMKKCIWRERLACIMCPRGPPGRRGRMGLDGEKGVPGGRGAPGFVKTNFYSTRGPPGRPGEPGIDGTPGRPGMDGENGKNGYRMIPDRNMKGPPGPMGERGPPGRPGFPGDHGLPGPMGPPGYRGENGRRGASGEPGRPGRGGKFGGDSSYCPCPSRSFVVGNFKQKI